MEMLVEPNRERHIIDVINLERFKTRLPIDAVLMAGGKGERLRPLTEKTPKPLLLVGDKAIIDHNIDRLISYGVQHISVTVNYLKEQIEEHFAEPHNGVQVQTVREPKFLGTIGSIKFVKEFYNDTVLVMNSDLFTNINYEDFYLHFKEHDAEMSVALEEIPEDSFFNATDLIEKLIAEGKKVIRFPMNGTWIDIGNPQEYQKANELVKHLG